MKPSLKLALLSFSILTISPTVLAQNYSGTIGDLNTIFDPPMNINGTLCDTHTNTGNEHAYKACSDGVSAARWMAEKYAKNTGKYLGCLDGFYQGVSDGYNAGINPTQEMTKLASAYVKNANFDSATSRGLDKAKAEGQTESADQIIARYRSVIGLRDARGNAVLPNKDYNYPKVTFNGFEDGYEYDVLKEVGTEFDTVYATGWVNKDSRFEDRLAARKALALQKEYANNLCNQTDTIFGRRNMPVVSIWDFFRANRQYNFQNYGWRNPDWAWEIFDRDERTLEQYQTFTRLKNLEKTVTRSVNITEKVIRTDAAGNPVRKLDAAGQPAVDAQGKPVFEYDEKIVGSRVETTREKLSDTEVQALMNIYINGFKQAYDRFYARQYASQNYHQEGIEKYKIAKIIGKSMGEEVANHIARREAYNTQYKLQSAKKYAEEVKRIYKFSFDRLIDIFENNSVVELNEAEVIGQVQDAIFRPGEELKVAFTVTNLGEKASQTSMNFEATPDVQASTTGFTFTAPVLARNNYVTNVLGKVSNDFEARETANIGMAIRNPGDLAEVAKSLIVRKQKSILLNDYVEIDAAQASPNYLEGKIVVSATLKNPAKGVESPIAVVETSIEGVVADSKNVEPLAPGATRPFLVTIENVDPLEIINSGTLNGSVAVKMANKIAHRHAISASIRVQRNEALVDYFNALAVGKPGTSLGAETMDMRLATLGSLIDAEVMKSIKANIRWEKESDETIIKTIQSIYDEAKRAKLIDNEAQAIYDELGKLLAENVREPEFKAGGGLRLSSKGNKEDYLKQIAKFAKISTKLKNWD